MRTIKLGSAFLGFVSLVAVPALAQSIYVYPTAVTAPKGSYQTVTAIVTGVNDKTVTWTASGGTLVGTNPGTANEPNTIALTTTTAGTYTLTATSNANHSVTATSTVTFTASPTPATTHPRLLVTAAMLPGLQAKAISTNPMYEGFLNYTNTYMYTPDSSIWTFSTWNGSACTGGSGPSSDQTGNYREADANAMAWFSMIAPTSALRNQYGCAARDIWVYVMTNVISGAEGIVGNHWSDDSVAFATTTDWLMAGGYLSSSDLTLARQYSAFMLKTVLNYAYGITAPVSTYNSACEFNIGAGCVTASNDLQNMRTYGNNYSMSKALYLAALSLTFNDNTTDDPLLTGAYNKIGRASCRERV